MEKSPIVIEDDAKSSKPIVSIDLTLSPPSKPIKTEHAMAIDTPGFPVKRTITSTGGTRITTTPMIKEEEQEGKDCYIGDDGCSKAKKPRMSFSEFLDATNTKVLSENDPRYLAFVKKERMDESEPVLDVEPISVSNKAGFNQNSQNVSAKSEQVDESETKPQVKPIPVKKELDGFQVGKQEQKPKLVQPISSMPQSLYSLHLKREREGVTDDKKLNPILIENGDFEGEPDWLLVGRTAITGVSTTKGRKLEDNEIVHFAFPNIDSRSKSSYWTNSRAAIAASGIVRFSTKRSGEVTIYSYSQFF